MFFSPLPSSLGNNKFLLAPEGTARRCWGLCCEHRRGKTWRPSRWPPGCQDGGLPVSVHMPERQKGKVSRQIGRRTVASPKSLVTLPRETSYWSNWWKQLGNWTQRWCWATGPYRRKQEVCECVRAAGQAAVHLAEGVGPSLQ